MSDFLFACWFCLVFFYYYYFFPLFFFFLNRVYNIIICLIQLRTKHHRVAYIHNVKFQYIVKTYQLTFKITFDVLHPRPINVLSNYGFIFRLSMNDNGSYELYACRVQHCNIFFFTKYRNILRKVSRKEMVVLDIS